MFEEDEKIQKSGLLLGNDQLQMNRGASDPALKRAIDVQMSGVGNQSKYSKHTGLTKDDS